MFGGVWGEASPAPPNTPPPLGRTLIMGRPSVFIVYNVYAVSSTDLSDESGPSMVCACCAGRWLPVLVGGCHEC